MNMKTIKMDRKFAIQLLLLQCALLTIVIVAHITVLHAVRSMEADQFVRSHRNDIVGGNWRRVELSGDFLVAQNFQSIKFTRQEKHDLGFAPGKISRTIFLDERSKQPFGEVKFRYDTLHKSGFSVLFLIMIDAICLAIMLVIRQQLSKQLHQEQEVLRLRAITQSVQMIAHDVRKPFFMVNGILEGIHSKEFNDPQEFQSLVASAKRVSHQVDDMLADVLALDSHIKILQTAVYPRELFLVSKAIVGLRFPNIAFSVKSQLPALFVDATKMQRVFTNIMMNAAEAMKGEGEIWCNQTRSESGFVTIRLGNTNSYIPPEKCKRIFLPFYSGEESKGSGLGLAIVKRIVEAHDGSVEVQSSKKDGTIFSIKLPLASEQQEQESVVKDRPIDRIAVVEDCPLTMHRWKKLLAGRANYFISPREFYASLRDNEDAYSYVVTDYFFDNDVESGYDLAKRVKTIWPNCEVVLTTNDLTQKENDLFNRIVDKQDMAVFVTEKFGSN